MNELSKEVKKFILGMDIGYSNLKLAFGDDKQANTQSLPVGAGAVELLPLNIMGEVNNDGLCVFINNKEWVAGVEPKRLQGWVRNLHADYSETDSYKALFYASLLLSEREEIDLLVTGLPVEQALNRDKKEALIQKLKGVHKITPKVMVNVKDVLVVPQPIGAFLHTISSLNSNNDFLDDVINGKTIIIDPGFFSVDWVVFDKGELKHEFSGTNLKAMSVLIEEIHKTIKRDYGVSSSKEDIEETIRTGNNKLYIRSKKVDITPYIQDSANKVAEDALLAIRTSIRDIETELNTVVLAGGGAKNYETSVKSVFPDCKIIVSSKPVLANALGFFHCGKEKLRQL